MTTTAPVGYSGGATSRVAIRLDHSADPTPVAVTLTAPYQRTHNEVLPPPRGGTYNSDEVATFDGREAAALITAGGAVLVE